MSEEARAFLAARTDPVRLVIFDCDGVLIDSESLCNRVESAMLTELGWALTPDECHQRFLGLSFYDMVPLIEAQLGRRVGTPWVHAMVDRLTKVLATESCPIRGAWDAVTGVEALGLPWRIASNSSHTEMDAKFTCVGWSELVSGRVHSAADMIGRGGRGKPAPDVFLEAAAAAGMACLGYSPDHDGAALKAAGAIPFRQMQAIPALLRIIP